MVADSPQRLSSRVAPLVTAARSLILIAVLGSFFTAVAVMITGVYETIHLVLTAIGGDVEYAGGIGRYVAITSLELIDLFLIGAVLLVIAIGLYQVYVNDVPDLPPGLRVHTIEELKERILGIVVVLLGIVFLGFAATWDGSGNILALGAAVALVMGAIGYVFHLFSGHGR